MGTHFLWSRSAKLLPHKPLFNLGVLPTRRCLVPVVLSDGAGAFHALGAVLYEQAAGFYADDARRVLQAHAERRQPPPEANARTAFKVLRFEPCNLVCYRLRTSRL